jgi:succinate dehydrogenase/fumarate reductase iron-sulfur protein
MQRYAVPRGEYRNVLEALSHVYEHEDSTLAFRVGCRYKTCGLCAIEIDGAPKIACLTKLKDEMVLRPLPKLPVVRDLVVDRRGFFRKLRSYRLFVPDRELVEPERLTLSEEYRQLAQCRECLCCLAGYAPYRPGVSAFESPYVFVKLAQMHHDPRDVLDRKTQARALGIEHYRGVVHIPCPFRVPIVKAALQPLLAE